MVVIIPARLASTRLPGKMLLPLGGAPLVVQTAANAHAAGLSAIIATDAEQIAEAAREHGYEAVLTGCEHPSGSDRLAEAADILGLADDELIINLQGDEPLFGAENLREFAAFASARAGEYFMASAYAQSTAPQDANKVKVVCDAAGYAMYFSRAMIPFDRDGSGICGGADGAAGAGATLAGARPWRHHIGIYAYSAGALREFVKLRGTLEHIEKLEQLRALENGKKILMKELAATGFGIDSPEDYTRAQKIFS